MKPRFDSIGQSGRQAKRLEKQRKRLQVEVVKLVQAVIKR